MLRNQKDAFYFDDNVVAIMVGMGLFILPFLGEFAISTFWLETFWVENFESKVFKPSQNLQWERYILWYENVQN